MHNQFERHENFQSHHVRPRHVDVWLPPGYAAEPERRYPVLYAHDGQNLFDPRTSYGGIDWGVDEALEGLIAAKEAEAAIVVGIWNTDMRWEEYLPQRPFEDLPPGAQIAMGLDRVMSGKPISDAYLRFIVDELKPFVDARYRTRPQREATCLMGSSMGGLISLYGTCEYPEIFSGAACLSTHWPAGDGKVIDYMAAHLPPPGACRFYFDYGTETLDALYEPYQERADAVMRAAGYAEGVDWITLKFEGAEHTEGAWRERVHIPLRFLLGRA